MSEWVRLHKFPSRMEAEVVKGLLAGEGIETQIVSDDLGGLRPDLGFVQGVQLWVKEEDAYRATQILDADSSSD